MPTACFPMVRAVQWRSLNIYGEGGQGRVGGVPSQHIWTGPGCAHMGMDPRGQTDRQTQLKTLLSPLRWRTVKMSANPISELFPFFNIKNRNRLRNSNIITTNHRYEQTIIGLIKKPQIFEKVECRELKCDKWAITVRSMIDDRHGFSTMAKSEIKKIRSIISINVLLTFTLTFYIDWGMQYLMESVMSLMYVKRWWSSISRVVSELIAGTVFE